MLPLRRRLVFSALVVGSMAPDFEYFFGVTRTTSHAMPGIVIFTFPLALAVLVLFHTLIKWPLISLLPRGLQARVIGPARRFRLLPATRFLAILVSLALGIATHILWDGFTHVDGWAVVRSPSLRHFMWVPAHRPMHVFVVLQLASTLLGILVLTVALVMWYRRATVEDVALRPQFSPAAKWAILSIMTATAIVLGAVNGADWYRPLLAGASHRMQVVAGFAITTLTVGAVEMFGFSLIWRAFLAPTLEPQRRLPPDR